MPGVRSTVSKHPQRAEIERLLRAGEGVTSVAEQFGLSRQAVSRYKARLAAVPVDRGEGDGARGVVRGQLMQLFNETTELMKMAKAAKAPRSFLAATSEARKLLNAIDKVVDKLDATPAVPVAATSDINVEEMQAVILAALTKYPEARREVAKALIAHHDGEGGGDK